MVFPSETVSAPAEKWIHVSDLHFGTETLAVCEALREFVEAQDPRGLVVSGDVTQRAKPKEFRAAAHFLSDLAEARRLLVVPGNHDLPLFRVFERLFAPYARFQGVFGAIERVRTVDVGSFRFVLVNTTRRFRHKHGTLDRDQISSVARALDGAPEASVRAIVLHHPLPAFDDTGGRFRGDFADMSSAELAVRTWSEVGLDLVFCGRTHHPRVLRLTAPEEPVLTLESAAPRARLRRTPWLVQAGTSLSRRLRSEPNSLHLLVATSPAPLPGDAEGSALPARSARHNLRLERWDFSTSTQKFERISQILLN